MSNIIGIFCGNLYFPKDKMHHWDENNLIEGGIGGSEIWAIEIAKQFIKKGYRCIIFGDPSKSYVSDSGIEYVTMEKTVDIIERTKFKYFIASRKTFILQYNIKAEHIYLMLHDPFVLFADSYEDLYMEKVSKIAVQSDFQKRMLKEKYKGLTNNDFFKTFQGVDKTYYDDADAIPKKNKMLWSSHKIRGSKFLIERVFPLIKKEIPDFEIDVCGYANDMNDEYFSKEGINIKGNVSKKELAFLQKESKIWIYPNFGLFENGNINDETFCITAVENALAKNALVLADRTCFSTTLKGYKGFVGTELFDNEDILPEDKMDEFAQILAQQSIKLLKDEEYRREIVNNVNEICKKYTWENAIKTFIDEFGKDEAPRKSKRIIVLSAICHRGYNLGKMFESIKNNLCNDAKNHVTWIICPDKYHNADDFTSIVEKCKEYSEENPWFGWFLYPSGKDQDENYGGDIFNEPLKNILPYYENENTWVYVLDDDNTINPLMGEIVNKSIDIAEQYSKKCICFNMLYEDGVLAPYVDKYFNIVTKEGRTAHYQIVDPSQLLIKSNLLIERGGYPSGFDYDKEIWNFLKEEGFNEILFPNVFLGNYYMNNYQTTHNGISSNERKMKGKCILDNDEAKSCYISIATNKEGNLSFMVDYKKIRKYFEELVD